MRLVICILSLIANIALDAYGQKVNNNWCFGKGVGLNFNTSPPSLFINTNSNCEEGSSTISDNKGNLLFYSNGLSIYNNKNKVIKNGGGIFGDLSSTDNVIIIKQPQNDSLYFVFSVGSAGQTNKGFRYSIINKNGDNGNGEVTQKNILIEQNIFEKLAVTRHCNGRDFWIVVRQWNSDIYYTFLLTNNGVNVNNKITSNTGLVIGGDYFNSMGALKFSIKSNKLGAVHGFENRLVELMDFNNSTGQITNAINFKTQSATTPQFFSIPYSLEFSPNEKLLYVSNNTFIDDGENSLAQYDITSNIPATIEASRLKLYTSAIEFAGAIQIAVDKKIYFTNVNSNYLSVVEQPDVKGLGCAFVKNKINFEVNGQVFLKAGLSSLVSSYFDDNVQDVFFTTDQTSCKAKQINFKINPLLTAYDSVKWDFGDNSISTIISPTHVYNKDTIYRVNLKVYFKRCGEVVYDDYEEEVFIASAQKLLPEDTAICSFGEGIAIKPNFDLNKASYLWNNASTDYQIIVKDTGLYWLQLKYNNCTLVDTIIISKKEVEQLKIFAANTFVCINKPITLSTNIINANLYEWSTGEKLKSITINKPGQYKVTVVNRCTLQDSIQINLGDCDFFIPNSFTPNNDGKNDLFGPVNEFYATNYNLKIFDRWSKVIFSSNTVSKKWNGSNNGKPLPNGSYLWILQYTNRRGVSKYEQGMVTLIR